MMVVTVRMPTRDSTQLTARVENGIVRIDGPDGFRREVPLPAGADADRLHAGLFRRRAGAARAADGRCPELTRTHRRRLAADVVLPRRAVCPPYADSSATGAWRVRRATPDSTAVEATASATAGATRRSKTLGIT